MEGVDDCKAFLHISDQYYGNGLIANKLEDAGIVIIPIGGCGSIKHWVSLDLLRTLNKPFYIYLDSDKESEESVSPNAEKLIDYGFVEGTNFSVSRKREIENYMIPSALERLVSGCNMAFTDWCDVKEKSKQSPCCASLGGKKIASKHFSSLTYQELQTAFNPSGNDDEFLEVYSKVIALIEDV